MAGFGLESAQYSTFPAKINDLQALPGAFGGIPALQLSQRALPSVSGSGVRRKIFLEFAFLTLEVLRVGRRFLFLGDIWPSFGILGIPLKPLFEPRLGVRLDGVGRAFRL